MTTKLMACVVVPHLLTQLARQAAALPHHYPIAVVTDTTDRATVIDRCSRAGAAGVQVGMSAYAARRQCRRLHVATVPSAVLDHATSLLAGVLARYSDVVLCRTAGTWFLELVALGRAYAQALPLAQQIRQAVIQMTSWSCAIGLAATSGVARIAAHVAEASAPSHVQVVLPGTETVFLQPLPVTLVPGVGQQTETVLARLGITTIGELAAVPETMLVQLVGARGHALYRHAHGRDGDDMLAPAQTITSVWRWGRAPTVDRRQILARVYRLTERVGRHLRAQGLAAGAISVQVRWVDGRQRQATQRLTVRCDLDRELARGSRAALNHLLRERRLAVAEARVTIGDLGPLQVQLWEDDDRPRRCQQALDQIKQRHGTSAILLAWMLPRRTAHLK